MATTVYLAGSPEQMLLDDIFDSFADDFTNGFSRAVKAALAAGLDPYAEIEYPVYRYPTGIVTFNDLR